MLMLNYAYYCESIHMLMFMIITLPAMKRLMLLIHNRVEQEFSWLCWRFPLTQMDTPMSLICMSLREAYKDIAEVLSLQSNTWTHSEVKCTVRKHLIT